MTALLNLTITLGMVVVVPLGLRLVTGPPSRLVGPWLVGAWLVAAIPAAVSLWLPRGWIAAGLAGGYAGMTVALAAIALRRWVAGPRSSVPRELALLTALVAPSVAGGALVAERLGVELFGFDLPVLSLTVAHFHFAGFAAALIAALVCASTRDDALARLAALCVPAGLLIVLIGFFTGAPVELAGTVVLTVGMWLVAWLTWSQRHDTDRVVRVLFAVAAAVPVASMALAVQWALARVVGLPHLSVTWMAATHGVANAVGFALCSMLAWQRKGVRPDGGSDVRGGRRDPAPAASPRVPPSAP
jgi:hypothetical protein